MANTGFSLLPDFFCGLAKTAAEPSESGQLSPWLDRTQVSAQAGTNKTKREKIELDEADQLPWGCNSGRESVSALPLIAHGSTDRDKQNDTLSAYCNGDCPCRGVHFLLWLF